MSLLIASLLSRAGTGGVTPLPPPTTIPLSEWTLDETTGATFFDVRPASVAMTIVGTWNNRTLSSMVAGNLGTSVYRGTGGAYATLPADNPAHALAEMTLSLYYQRNSATANHMLLSIGGGTQPGDLELLVQADGKLSLWHVAPDGLRYAEGQNGITGTNLAVGVAHRIDISFGQLGVKTYINGVFQPAAWIASNTNAWNNTRVKYLGMQYDGVSLGADGIFDEIRLWGGQLTDQEVASLQPAQSISLGAAPAPVAVNFNAGDLIQGTAGQTQDIDVLGVSGTVYTGVPTIAINSQTPSNLGATVDTNAWGTYGAGERPRLIIPIATLQSAWSVTWTLTNSGGAGSSQATASGRVVAPVVVQDLVSQWRLDNSDGVTFPDTGPANLPMTLVKPWGNLTLGSMVTGVAGTSAWPGTAGAYATLPANQAAHNLSALTLSIYYQRNSALAKHVLFALGDPNTAAIGDMSLEVLQNGQLRGYHVGQDGVLRNLESPNGITGTNLAVGVAHRIDLTMGPAGDKIYLDGTPFPNAFTALNTNGWNNAAVKYLGIYTDGVQAGADGAFDQIRLYNRQLSDNEIMALPAAQSINITGLPDITTDLTSYAVGDTITATAINGPNVATNAVGLYLATTPVTDQPVNWKYLASNNQTLPGSGAVSGTVTFPTTGLAVGQYIVRLTDIPWVLVPLVANADSISFAVNTGNHDIDVLANDTYTGTPTISITSQTGPGTATIVGTGVASRIRVPTDGLATGTKSVTYQLTATGNTGNSSATLTATLQALGAPVAVDDSAPAVNVDTGNYDIDVLVNDTYSGTPTLTISSQTGPGTATIFGTGTSSRIRIPTAGLTPGTKTVTYSLIAANNSGSATAILTIAIQAAVGAGQLGLWHFAETSGLTFADSVGTNTATLAIPSWTVQTHVLDRAGIQVGTDHAIEVSNGGPAIPMIAGYKQTAMTLVIYMEPRSSMRGLQYWNTADERYGREAIAWCDNGLAGSFGIYRRWVTSYTEWRLGGFVRDSANAKVYFSGIPGISGQNLLPDVAHRIVLTQSATGANLYLDNVLAATISTTTGWSGLTGSIQLGCTHSTGHTNDRSGFWGRLDEVSVYQNALSLAQVQALPAARSGRIWKYPSDFVGGSTDINIAGFAGNLQAGMRAAASAGRYLYQDETDLTVYTGPASQGGGVNGFVGDHNLLEFLPGCKGMLGIKLRCFQNEGLFGRIIQMSTAPNGAMGGHGDRYATTGGYKFIGCDLDGNARNNNWSVDGNTAHTGFDLQQQHGISMLSTSSEGYYTVLIDSCNFRDGCGDAVSPTGYVTCNAQSNRMYGYFRGPYVSGGDGHTTLNLKVYESRSDNSFGVLNGCGMQDIEIDVVAHNLVAYFYDAWADADFDETTAGTGSSTHHFNIHTIGASFAVVNGWQPNGPFASGDGWDARYCTFSYNHDYGYPQALWYGFATALGATGALFENCIFLANGTPFMYHNGIYGTSVNTIFSFMYTPAGTQSRLWTMRNCEWRVKALPSGIARGNIRAYFVNGTLGTGQSVELDNVKVDAAFTDLPFLMGGVNVRWRNTLHEGTGSSTIWSGAGSTTAF